MWYICIIFLLVSIINRREQQYDDYLTYGGVKISDFFTAAGIDLAGATCFTVFAPDGYKIYFYLDDLVLEQFTDSIFYDIPDFVDLDTNFGKHPDALPQGITSGSALTDLWTILAYKRDGWDLIEEEKIQRMV